MAKFCPHCGARLNDDDGFCSSCGTKLTVSPHTTETIPSQHHTVIYQEDKSLEDMFLRKEGRLNRLRYFKRMLAVLGARIGVVIILWAILSDSWGNTSAGVDALIAIISIGFAYPEYCLTLRRLQDLNEKNLKMAFWFAGIDVLTIIMSSVTLSQRAERKMMIFGIAYLIFFIYLLVKVGTPGANQYGPDPLGPTQ